MNISNEIMGLRDTFLRRSGTFPRMTLAMAPTVGLALASTSGQLVLLPKLKGERSNNASAFDVGEGIGRIRYRAPARAFGCLDLTNLNRNAPGTFRVFVHPRANDTREFSFRNWLLWHRYALSCRKLISNPFRATISSSVAEQIVKFTQLILRLVGCVINRIQVLAIRRERNEPPVCIEASVPHGQDLNGCDGFTTWEASELLPNDKFQVFSSNQLLCHVDAPVWAALQMRDVVYRSASRAVAGLIRRQFVDLSQSFFDACHGRRKLRVVPPFGDICQRRPIAATYRDDCDCGVGKVRVRKFLMEKPDQLVGCRGKLGHDLVSTGATLASVDKLVLLAEQNADGDDIVSEVWIGGLDGGHGAPRITHPVDHDVARTAVARGNIKTVPNQGVKLSRVLWRLCHRFDRRVRRLQDTEQSTVPEPDQSTAYLERMREPLFWQRQREAHSQVCCDLIRHALDSLDVGTRSRNNSSPPFISNGHDRDLHILKDESAGYHVSKFIGTFSFAAHPKYSTCAGIRSIQAYRREASE